MTHCHRGHPLRFDQARRRFVCDECERHSSPKKKAKRVPAAHVEQVEVAPSPPESAHSSGLPAKQTKLALQPGPRLTLVPDEPEESMQNRSVQVLFDHGFKVLVNTVHLKGQTVTCPGCDRRFFVKPRQETGQTPGIPDLDATHLDWRHPLLPAALWLGLEQKARKGRLSPAQTQLHEDGLTVVARSTTDNLQAVQQVDRFFSYVRALERLAAHVAPSAGADVETLLKAIQDLKDPK